MSQIVPYIPKKEVILFSMLQIVPYRMYIITKPAIKRTVILFTDGLTECEEYNAIKRLEEDGFIVLISYTKHISYKYVGTSLGYLDKRGQFRPYKYAN